MKNVFRLSGRGENVARGQQGFTLIELSIVLAIIGLIVGGVLKGQELLNNARMKTQVAQIDTVKSAVLTFQDRYGYLPGDFTQPTSLGLTALAAGNGNGVIEDGTNAFTADDFDAASTKETAGVWAELGAANLIGGYVLGSGITSIASATTAASAVLLPGKVSSTWLWLASFNGAPAGIGTAQTNLAVRLQGVVTATTPGRGTITATAGNALKETDAFGLDTKYDDGVPSTGAIYLDSVSTNCISSATAPGVYGLASGISATNANCVLLFNVQ